MKRLILMRHAKSDWTGGATTDHARVLNARGRDSAALLGRWMADTGLRPDKVFCSSAQRTQETLERLQIPAGVETDVARSLYLAEPQKILSLLRKAAGEVVLIIGHNPGIGEMAARVLQDMPSDQGFHNYPTGATLVADFDIDEWKEASWGTAQLAHFVVPRDL